MRNSVHQNKFLTNLSDLTNLYFLSSRNNVSTPNPSPYVPTPNLRVLCLPTSQSPSEHLFSHYAILVPKVIGSDMPIISCSKEALLVIYTFAKGLGQPLLFAFLITDNEFLTLCSNVFSIPFYGNA